jgi:hypothetical protein
MSEQLMEKRKVGRPLGRKDGCGTKLFPKEAKTRKPHANSYTESDKLALQTIRSKLAQNPDMYTKAAIIQTIGVKDTAGLRRLSRKLKTVPPYEGMEWSVSQKCWIFPPTPELIALFCADSLNAAKSEQSDCLGFVEAGCCG